jgi:CRP/FNR family transcriptional regulator
MAMMDYRPHVKTCSDCGTCLKVEWSELDQAGLEQLASSLRTFYYQPGEVIFHQSDAPQGIYCIDQGKILLCQYDFFGNEIGFGVAYQGETVGWRSFFARENHSATARALTSCRICLIPEDTIHRLIRGYPALAQRFLRTVARDRGPTESLLLRNPRLPARIRLINLLLIFCNNTYKPNKDGEMMFRLPINRQQLASLIGVRSETLSRTIAILRKEGLARFHDREVTIANHDRLVHESNRDKRLQ